MRYFPSVIDDYEMLLKLLIFLCLQSFFHKNFPSASCPALTSMIRKWNMSQIPKLRDKLNSVLNVEQRCLAEKIMEQFEKQVLSIDHKYSKGMCAYLFIH